MLSQPGFEFPHREQHQTATNHARKLGGEAAERPFADPQGCGSLGRAQSEALAQLDPVCLVLFFAQRRVALLLFARPISTHEQGGGGPSNRAAAPLPALPRIFRIGRFGPRPGRHLSCNGSLALAFPMST